MNISIVIPTLHSDSLEQTLRAIALQTALGEIEAVIAAGQQKPQAISGLPQLRYVEVAERPTPARNRNAGAAQVTSDWILFTDSDCLPRADWVERMLSAAKSGDRQALAGAVDVPTSMPYWGRCDHLLGFEQQAAGLSTSNQVNHAATLNFAIRRQLFMELGGFDEHFERAGGEDRDLCWRLVHHGQTIHYVPEAIVIHNHPRSSFRSAWRHIYQYGQATAQFRLRHLEQAPLSWRLGAAVVRLPVAGEAASILRACARAIARPIRQPKMLRFARHLPGIALLDLAHSLGMIHALRRHAA